MRRFGTKTEEVGQKLETYEKGVLKGAEKAKDTLRRHQGKSIEGVREDKGKGRRIREVRPLVIFFYRERKCNHDCVDADVEFLHGKRRVVAL